MRFEWDFYKATSNVIKHGISFQQAITVFDDLSPLIIEDLTHSTTDEKRYQIIGEVAPEFVRKYRILTIVFTIRGAGHAYRLISARPASRIERRIYEIQKRS